MTAHWIRGGSDPVTSVLRREKFGHKDTEQKAM